MRLSLAAFEILLGATVLACASAPRAKPVARIDHLVVGVADLAAAIETIFAATGVRPVVGGEHPGRGTHNALLALGDRTYLELIAARPGADGPELEEMRALARPTPIAWAVAFDDVEEVASALRGAGFAPTAANPGSRQTPAGGVLRWETFRLEPSPIGAPFFIRWMPDSTHPSENSPTGCSLGSVELASPDASALVRLRDALQLPVSVVASEVPRIGLVLQCPRGTVALPGGD